MFHTLERRGGGFCFVCAKRFHNAIIVCSFDDVEGSSKKARAGAAPICHEERPTCLSLFVSFLSCVSLERVLLLPLRAYVFYYYSYSSHFFGAVFHLRSKGSVKRRELRTSKSAYFGYFKKREKEKRRKK